MKKITLFAVFMLAAAVQADAIMVHGHRGSRGTAPENTIPAFQQALEAGVDYIECDMNCCIVSESKVIAPSEPSSE